MLIARNNPKSSAQLLDLSEQIYRLSQDGNSSFSKRRKSEDCISIGDLGTMQDNYSEDEEEAFKSNLTHKQ